MLALSLFYTACPEDVMRGDHADRCITWPLLKPLIKRFSVSRGVRRPRRFDLDLAWSPSVDSRRPLLGLAALAREKCGLHSSLRAVSLDELCFRCCGPSLGSPELRAFWPCAAGRGAAMSEKHRLC